MENGKWVACWGNATSIIDQKECTYAKNMTLRYPVRMFLSGTKIRFHFSNISGTEPIRIRASFAREIHKQVIDPETIRRITLGGQEEIVIPPGEKVVSDEMECKIEAGETISVSIYLEDYTQMNAGVLITGPLSVGYYSYGNHETERVLPLDDTRRTGWFFFLNTIDIYTDENNHALICYGDSLTAQDWPDYLALRLWKSGIRNTAVVRRAISGTRILREYNCTTYAAYGRKGDFRFRDEMDTAGADLVIIQHGINDIIHPVGSEVNPWRPWSDLPQAKDLTDGIKDIYLAPAKEMGYKVYAGTLLPIYGWRTYADFRESLKEEVNGWLRTSDLFDGCVDFDKALRDPSDPRKFLAAYDSGDHLHPSKAGYEAMADCIDLSIFR